MKKFVLLITSFMVICIAFSGCSQKPTLDANVSELRSDVFVGQTETLTLKASYGFKEEPFINDGVVGEKISILSFKLTEGYLDGVNYSINFENNGEVYKSDFKLNPVKHTLVATVEIQNFEQKEFTVNLLSSGKSQSVVMKSALPEGTLTSSETLLHLHQKQSGLISAFSDENGNFNAELYLRVIVKEDKPFWYVGIASGNDNLKALLVDGFTGEVLAIREIF